MNRGIFGERFTIKLPRMAVAEEASQFRVPARFLAIVLVVATLSVLIENTILQAYFPHSSRVTTDFSPAYLKRELQALAAAAPQTIFLGDSVLWGYNLRAQDTAISILKSKGCECENLSFKASSPPNYYALVLLMQRYRVRPKLVVIEVDQRVLQEANSAYATLHPAVAALAQPLLTDADRKLFGLVPPKLAPIVALDQLGSSLSTLYAMRADIRETLVPTPDVTPVLHPTADMFYAEFDLTPLSDRNLGVRYLINAVDLLKTAHIPVLAFMTPTNHTLLHEYIDGPEYQSNVSFLERMLRQRGVHVLNIDRAFAGRDFFDSSHLKAGAQTQLAKMLEGAIKDALSTHN